jgi:hypothetical protein
MWFEHQPWIYRLQLSQSARLARAAGSGSGWSLTLFPDHRQVHCGSILAPIFFINFFEKSAVFVGIMASEQPPKYLGKLYVDRFASARCANNTIIHRTTTTAAAAAAVAMRWHVSTNNVASIRCIFLCLDFDPCVDAISSISLTHSLLDHSRYNPTHCSVGHGCIYMIQLAAGTETKCLIR